MTATETPLAVPDVSPGALAAVTAEIAASAAEYDRTGAIPQRGLAAAHRAGLLTATVARRYGGPEVGTPDVLRILVALGEGDASVALLAANNLNVHHAQAEHPYWPERYYTDLLRRNTAGPALTNTVRAERELGAPARGGVPATTAPRVPRLASLAQPPRTPTVPVGSAITHRPPAIIAPISSGQATTQAPSRTHATSLTRRERVAGRNPSRSRRASACPRG